MNKIVESIRKLTDHVCVGFSCGKDSVVALDMCYRVFPKISSFFMFLVPNLSFQENYLKYIEMRYHIEIIRIPHFGLSDLLKDSVYRADTGIDVPRVKINYIEEYVRKETGCQWIAYGQKATDSIERRARLKRCGGIEFESRRFFPIADFNRQMVFNHIKMRNLRIAPDYQIWGRSFGRLWPKELIGIKQHFPDDYAKIKEVFPYVEAQIKRSEFGDNEISKIREGDNTTGRNKKRGLQSSSH